MAKASDNVFPSVLLAEGAAPTSPSAGQHRLFVDTADDKLKRKDSAGTVSVVEGGSVAFSGARVYNNANIATATGSGTYLTFNTERYDTDAFHSTGSNTGRLTAPVSGYYVITGSVMFANHTNGARGADIRLNGTTQIGQVRVPTVVGTDVTIIQVVSHYYLTAADYVELGVWQTSGGSLDVVYTGDFSPEFTIQKVG